MYSSINVVINANYEDMRMLELTRDVLQFYLSGRRKTQQAYSEHVYSSILYDVRLIEHICPDCRVA